MQQPTDDRNARATQKEKGRSDCAPDLLSAVE